MGAESQEQGCVGEGGWGRVLVGGTENAGHLRRAHVSKGGEKGHTGEREGPCRTEFSSPASCFTDGETEGQRETAFDSFSQPASQPASHSFLQHLLIKSPAVHEGYPVLSPKCPQCRLCLVSN